MLREGDSGPEVEELQRRLRQIQGIYPGGEVDGRYDAEVTEAVARYQQWYGVRGDEEGVYGRRHPARPGVAHLTDAPARRLADAPLAHRPCALSQDSTRSPSHAPSATTTR